MELPGNDWKKIILEYDPNDIGYFWILIPTVSDIGLYDKDSIRFWRTTNKQEVDFVISTSLMEGLAFEVKMNCPDTNLPGKHKLMESNVFSLIFNHFKD